MKHLKMIAICGATLVLASCTKLEEQLLGEIPLSEFEKNPDIPGLLQGAYNSFRGPYQDQTGVFSLQDMSSDGAIGPTRGGDWDDNGVWRVLHTHSWDPDNQRIRDNFNNLLQVVFNATNVLKFPQTSAAQKAEALFLRAYAMYTVLDLYDQVPFREPGEDLRAPSQVVKGTEALNKIIADINAAIPNLGDGPAYRSNKWAARALLMKCYLNKGVYANRKSPTFAAADMDEVIKLGNEIVASGRFAVNPDFFAQFAPNNEASRELIFTNQNQADQGGNVRFHWHASTHYNQNPSGWNGFTTLASLYDSFEPTDQRRGVDYPGFTNRTGMRLGLLIGQQKGAGGVDLKDRAGNPLIFTRDITPVVSGNVELPGIRVVKYVPDMKPDFSGDKDIAENDYALLRFADVWLMMAEAHLRKGTTSTALSMVNTLRTARGASTLSSITLDGMLAERGRELYWESWRRSDMVRFGKFLLPYGPTKPNTSADKYLIFPIPNNQLAVNPNLTQNPGY